MKILILLIGLLLNNYSLAADYIVCFSPKNNCYERIVSLIDNTNTSLKIAIFSFTSKDIADAVVRAHTRRVNVQLIMDKQQSDGVGSQYHFLKEIGIPTKIDNTSGYMHNKYIISDDKNILTGSYNFTINADKRNFENFMISNDLELVEIYNKNFTLLWNKF